MIDAIARRLREEAACFSSVATTGRLAQVKPGGIPGHQLPAAFVHAIRDGGRENHLANGLSQAVDHDIGVLIVVTFKAYEIERDLPEGLFPLFTACRTALAGWTPPGEGLNPIRFRSGEVVSIGDGEAWWLETYRTFSYLRSV
ncbi:MAG: hypothetical protein KDH19_10945 [Geminicoccaceae bacterium]|nr:hypothetical protein [Geminicoccaceae bacterium]